MTQQYAPPKFTDALGREWNLTITLAAAQRIDQCDFSDLIDEPISFLDPSKDFFQLLLNKTSLQFAIIWCIIEPAAKSQGITQEDFCEAILPPQLNEAKQALWRAIADFFPQLRTSLTRLGEIHLKHLKTVDQKLAEAADRLEAVSGAEIDRALQDLERHLMSAGRHGINSTDSQRSPE